MLSFMRLSKESVLILAVEDAERLMENVTAAGSVFLGHWTPESLGDYCSGTNHVLPTYGFARAFSGLGVDDFQRRITVQAATPAVSKTSDPRRSHLPGLRAWKRMPRPWRFA